MAYRRRQAARFVARLPAVLPAGIPATFAVRVGRAGALRDRPDLQLEPHRVLASF